MSLCLVLTAVFFTILASNSPVGAARDHVLAKVSRISGVPSQAVAYKGAASPSATQVASVKHRGDMHADDTNAYKKFLKPGTYMLQSEVKPGMEGYGLSVFRGSKIERFHVKVIGVMKRVMNGKDAILVRLSGPTIGKNNVIRGMSGSPVYIDDKLIGAVSYGFDFSMEPIAGVTPIADMFDSIAKADDAPPVGYRESQREIALAEPNSSTSALSPYTISGPSADVKLLRRQMVGSAAPHMVRLMAPVSLTGFSNHAQDFLSNRFQRLGLSVSEGAGGGLDADLPKEDLKELSTLKPGSAVGVMLTTGDFESAAVGTTTAVLGDRVLAFGHPFVQAGMVDFPMTSAYIHDVLPSLAISFKLSSPVKMLGTVYADRPWSIGGQLGAKAKMVPLTIEVTDEERRLHHAFHSQVIDHQDLTPELISACTMSAIDATYQSSTPYVAYVNTVVDMDKAPAIERSDCLSNSYGGAGLAATAMKGPLFADPVAANIYAITSRVLSNKYQKVRLKGVVLKIRLKSGRNITRIVRVATDRAQVKPGDSVKLSCTLAPYDAEPYEKTLQVTIPRDAPDGDMVIGVCGGTQLDDMRRRMGLLDPPNTSLNQIVRKIQERAQGDKLFAVLSLPNQAIHIDGETIQSPPGHWVKLFFSNRYTHGPSLVNGERRVVSDMDTLLEGSHILAVEVKRPDEFMAKQPWYQGQVKGSAKATMGFYVTSQAQKAIDSQTKGDNKAKSDGSSNAASTDSSTSSSAKTPAAANLWTPGLEDPHIRNIQVWNQMDEAAFKGGTKDGIAIDSWGRVFPAFGDGGTVRVENALRAWCGTWSKDSFYFATSDKIYKLASMSSKPEQIAKLNCVVIPCMVSDNAGRLYVATAPGAHLVRIEPGKIASQSADGAVPPFVSLPESLISSLSTDGENIYAGVAGTGKVYKITPSGKATVIFDTGQAHVTSMFFDKNTDSLLVGCGEQGNVYSIARDGTVKSLFHSDEHLITGVCRTKGGDLFITTAGDGHLYRVSSSGEVSDLATSEAFYSLLYHDETGAVYAGDAEGDVTEIQEEPLTGNFFFVPVKHTNQEAVVSLTSDGMGNLYALSSNLPAVYKFILKPGSASFISPVKDAGRKSTWSHVRLFGAYNESNSIFEKFVSVQTRAGDTPQPDETWSGWLETTPGPDGFAVAGDAARYFQYRIRWLHQPASYDSNIFPWGRDSVIGRVSVTYLPTNLPPHFANVSLRSGTYLSDAEDITVVGNDPDTDSLSLNIDISSDRGKTWKSLQDDLRPEKTVAKTQTEKAKSTEKPKKTGKGKTQDGKIDSGAEPSKTDDDKTDDAKKDDAKKDDSNKDDSKSDEAQSEKSKSDDAKSDGSKKSMPDDSKSNESTPDNPPHIYLQGNEENPAPKDDGPDSGDKSSGSEKQDKPDQDNKNQKGSTAKTGGVKKSETKSGKGEDKSTASESSEKKKSGTEEQTEKFLYPLLTKTLKDGHYILRFTLSDAPSNMVNPQETRCYRYIIVDNSKPHISDARAQVGQDGALAIQAQASDDMSPIVNATFTIDDGDASSLATEGTSDSRSLKLSATGVKVRKGSHKIEIEVLDKANNKATKTIKVSVP